MNKTELSAPISISLVLALACAAGCSPKKSSSTPNADNSSAEQTNFPATNFVADSTINSTNFPPENIAATNLPATPEPAPTAPAVKHKRHKIVEMPAGVPSAPTNFYSGDFATNNWSQTPTTAENYFFRVRAGYEHTSHGDNSDAFYAAIKFYANGGDLRARAGKNAWLVPDADAEFSHQALPKPDGGKATGSDDGLELRASFFWPWLHWTTQMLSRASDCCEFAPPLDLKFGPTLNVGFDKVFDDPGARFNRYFGARMTFNNDGFIELTGGATDGLSGTRAQLLGELPVFTSRDHEVRYVLRGLWNTGGNSSPDVFEGGFFVEMPLEFLTCPRSWNDLNPFQK